MSAADIIILIIVILLLLTIIFFRFIFPLIRGKKSSHCSSCPVGYDAKIKRSLKEYRKSTRKDK